MIKLIVEIRRHSSGGPNVCIQPTLGVSSIFITENRLNNSDNLNWIRKETPFGDGAARQCLAVVSWAASLLGFLQSGTSGQIRAGHNHWIIRLDDSVIVRTQCRGIVRSGNK